ncbi:MAG: MaoC family dehydratase [Sciscionella sp.]
MNLPPADERYFEDYRAGTSYEFGSVTVSEREIIEFARQYDAQPFHVDPVAAVAGPFGGIVASGWHTLGLMMRLFVEHYLPVAASLGSPGVDEVRWLQPVRPGDSLRLRVTVLDARPSTSKPDRGIVRTGVEMFNQSGELVLTLSAVNLIARRQQ